MADETNNRQQSEDNAAQEGKPAADMTAQFDPQSNEIVDVDAVEQVSKAHDGSTVISVDSHGVAKTPSDMADHADDTNDQNRTDADGAPTAQQQQAAFDQGYRLAPQYGAYAPQGASPANPSLGDAHQPPVTTHTNPYGNQPAGGPEGPNMHNPFNPGPYTTTPPSASRPERPHDDMFGNPYAPQDTQHEAQQQPRGAAGLFGQPAAAPGQLGQSGQSGQPNNDPYVPGGFNGQQPAAPQYAKTPSNIIVAVVAALVSAALCLGLGYAALTNGWVKTSNSGATSSLPSSPKGNGGSGSAVVEGGKAPDWAAVSNQVSRSVVAIQTQMDEGGAQGSGAILDKEGHIVTNNHVISGAKKIQVTLDNGDIYGAKLVGTDTTTDLAVIKLENPPADLAPIEFADSDQLVPGEGVMAIGNPLGYDGTVTTGIVSALNRPVTVMDDDTEIVTNAVQIDAAVNPGNSGGPTFNAAGKVIGINSSIATTATSSSSAGSIGIGFAIPSNLVKRVSDEIIKNGKVQHVALGVTIQNSSATVDGVTRGGAEVKDVVSGGPADKAGIKSGDVIVAYDGMGVNNNYSLLGFVRAAAMGSTAKLTVVRGGKTLELNVTLDKTESEVNGSNRSENNQNNNRNNNQTPRDDDSKGGLYDPFGLW